MQIWNTAEALERTVAKSCSQAAHRGDVYAGAYERSATGVYPFA